MTKKLQSSQIAVGHCVIVNHIERPSGEMVAVIVGVENDKIKSKYLNADKKFSYYNKHDGMTNLREAVTPISDFGVQIHVDEQNNYWCEQTGESTATYKDGKIRKWQDYTSGCYPDCSGPASMRYIARKDVLNLTIKA